MVNIEYIEAYFNQQLSGERKKEFERRVITDAVFAEEVAFYLSSKEAAAGEIAKEKEKFKGIYAQYKHGNHTSGQRPALVRKFWPWVAAAAMLAGIIFSWNAWLKPASPHNLAEKYVKENFQALPVKMDSKQDSLQQGLILYNEGLLAEALEQFETIIQNDTTFSSAKKYAGIVALRLGQYDKALNYFSQLENYPGLYANPGKFYKALTLLKRNGPGDKPQGKNLLEQVLQDGLEGKETAKEWLNKW